MPAGNEVTGGSRDGLTLPSASEEPDCTGEELMSWEGLVLCVPRRPTARSKRLAAALPAPNALCYCGGRGKEDIHTPSLQERLRPGLVEGHQ